MNTPANSAFLRDGASDAVIKAAAHALAKGHLVAFPTETVYGLGADGLNAIAARRIFKVKGRPADHPVILHVADIALAKSLASQWPDAADTLSKTFWPGPMTLILKRAAHVPDAVTGGQDTVGVRIPSHPVALRLLKAFAATGSGVIAAPSANRFGAVSPTRASDVMDDIGDRLLEGDMVMDGGACDVGVESTIVDVSTGAPRILRPGGISRAAIAKCLNKNPADLLAIGAADQGLDFSGEAASSDMDLGDARHDARHDAHLPRVSGSLESHYSPRAHVILANPDQMQAMAQRYMTEHPGQRLACVMRTANLSANGLSVIGMPMDAAAYARELYARLHDLDAQGFDALLIELPPAQDAWEAVRDRLKRAAA